MVDWYIRTHKMKFFQNTRKTALGSVLFAWELPGSKPFMFTCSEFCLKSAPIEAVGDLSGNSTCAQVASQIALLAF